MQGHRRKSRRRGRPSRSAGAGPWLWLPSLGRPALVHRFPLGPATADALAAALLEDRLDRRAELLTAALQRDALLAAWAVCHAALLEPRLSPDRPWLAAFLARRLLELLSWSKEDRADPPGGAAEANAAQAWLAGHGGAWPADLPDRLSLLRSIGPIDRAPAPGPAQSATGERLPALCDKLRRLADLDARFAQSLETAKLDAMKELAYGAGHEINNPLANIAARAQTLLKEEPDPERRRKLAAINAQALRAHEMIADLMLFARPPRPVVAPFDLAQLLRQISDSFCEQAAAQRTELLVRAESECVLRADRQQIAAALRALGCNALEAVVAGGTVEFHLPPCGEHDSIEIVVRDSGPGIPPALRAHLFDPFFSGREAGRGLGMGLSKCWRIAAAHGGSIHVASPPGGGAEFRLLLPRNPGG